MKTEITELTIFSDQLLIQCPVCGISAVIPKIEDDPPTAAKLIQKCRNCIVDVNDLEMTWLDKHGAPVQASQAI